MLRRANIIRGSAEERAFGRTLFDICIDGHSTRIQKLEGDYGHGANTRFVTVA